MPSKTLDHCNEVTVSLNPAHSGSVQVTVGGSSGDGVVDVEASPGGEKMTVATGAQGAMGVNPTTQLKFHYRAEPSADQSVQITYALL